MIEFRDFTTLGWSTNQTVPVFGGLAGQNNTATVDALRRDLQGIYGQKILWGDLSRGNNGPNPTVPANPVRPSTQPQGSGLSLSMSVFAFMPLLLLI
jgi:Ras family protein